MARRRGVDVLEAALGAPQDTRTMAEMVAQRLRDAIVGGQLPPGTPLRLAQISERLGVSVMPVRDALHQLEAERLVDTMPRRGAVVSSVSIEDAEETYTVRAALEALAARHAVARLSDADLDDIRAAFDRMADAQASGDLGSYIEADHAFHQRLYQASGRDRLIRAISELTERSRRYSPYVYKAWLPLDRTLADHRPILEAIESRDPILAERLTYEHMSAAAARLVAAVEREARQKTG